MCPTCYPHPVFDTRKRVHYTISLCVVKAEPEQQQMGMATAQSISSWGGILT